MYNAKSIFNMNSIANRFRLAYLLFTLLLCGTFIAIFDIAEGKVEQVLVESYLLQQLQVAAQEGQLASDLKQAYDLPPDVAIYPLASAPENLKAKVAEVIQEQEVITDEGKEAELYFFKYHYQGQDFVLSYLDRGITTLSDSNQYPVLVIFEQLEDIFYKALIGVLLLSVLVALLFSYFSSKAIVKPILDLKKAVEADTLQPANQLGELTNLPTEVGVLARAIDDKNHKLSQYLKREQLFTGDVSHELRTPLTVIMGASEVLATRLEHDSKAIEFTNRISTTAKDTSDIISALLLLSREPEKLDKPLTSINTIVHNEVARLGYLVNHKPVSCVIEADREHNAHVRPELLKMALGNLIKNAFQYTDQGQVVIHIDAQKITVSDTGLGIPDSMMPLLYERFERIEPKHMKVEGSGLGLSIIQRIMTHLGWTLTHSNNHSGGSTFTIFYD